MASAGESEMTAFNLTQEETALLIKAIHDAQDVWAETADDLAASRSEEDHAESRRIEKEADRLNVIRRKLGDTSDPAPGVIPDTPAGL